MGLNKVDNDLLLKKLLETSVILVYVYDLDAHIPYFTNTHIHEVLGYTKEEVEAMGSNALSQLLHPDDWSNYSTNIQKLQDLKNGEELTKIDRYRTVEGTYKWFKNTRTVFTRNEDGTVKETLGIIQEITSEIQNLEKLKDAEEKFRSLFNSTTDFNFFVSLNYKILTLNLAAINYVEKFTGLKLKEGDYLTSVMNAEMLNDANSLMTKVLNNENVEVIKDYISPDGNEFSFKAKFFPVKNEVSKEIIGVQINVRDFTKIKTTNQILEQQNTQLKEIARINSHEIRRPLANILSLTELIMAKKIMFQVS
ncbi:MAG: PAS domain S-box protein [Chitinophagaceae bacterium]|jgi:PAS domain S-box-containing protein|nr:PAS domain S-box protein [Chitinophagaceae bacterium]